MRTIKGIGVAAALLAAAVASAQKMPNCAHCGIPIPVEATGSRLVTVKIGAKTYPVRCMLCARDLSAQYPGKAEVRAPTDDPKQSLVLTSDDKGNWTSNLPGLVFLEVEGDHAFCSRWSRAFVSEEGFRRYVAENPQYKEAKPLTLAEWSQREGKEMDHQHMAGMEHGDEMGGMMGKLGPWSMSREGSGTSWLPESSPMFMKPLNKQGRYDLSLMGLATLNYTDAGGKRGDSQFFSNSMPMLMARRETGGGTLGLNLMVSADPIINGQRGYPNLFQTGETAHGQPLVDRQHPHDLISELTVSYSHPVKSGMRWFVYGGPVGEPAFGGPMYLHRPSGMENPEAPITHHWFDATHISWGVVTAGVNTDKWQLEASAFNGHEPDENRYSPDPISLNSASARITYNPSRDLSFNAAYGYLNSPESKEPGVDQHRITFAGIYSRPLANGDNLSVTGAFGRNIKAGQDSNAYLLEATLFHGPTSIFARYENVDKDELVGVPPGSYNINKLIFGGVHNVASRNGFDIGIGAYAGLYSFPSSLEPFYGKNPVTLGVFLRVRPSRMKHEMSGEHSMPGMGGM
ncbi:hypothetical protein [Fimbriimonas ginsengisoli]|uniref:Uncharacterized protein n=1 Tax=Fimbriimonas ginsengisoli Gsoil 348 TaxID=661478 RepID=A0A068NJK5_FIMGI|nr:hypothetical protein [Fimbriimonas ginsengisoli]AIE83798.1 hypothetical protein OP10G_0430 [Fimbriimonas ginsengisoli Gsoil 348]